MQIKMVLLIASATFSFVIGSSFVSGKVYSFFYLIFVIIFSAFSSYCWSNNFQKANVNECLYQDWHSA